MGGLGNNLFQICCVLGYALKHGIDYCIPNQIENPHSANQTVYYSPKLKYCSDTDNGIVRVYREKKFEYEKIPFFDSVDTINLSGYWQSFKYFQGYRNEIITLLNIPKSVGYGKIFLHYRLGDYKTLGKFHKIIDDVYLSRALTVFYDFGYRDIMVFSDEIELAKKYLNPIGTSLRLFNWEYSEGKTELEDLSLMAACSGGIMSASSFSLWGAWLGNQDRLIIYPKDWFGEEYSETHSIKDLCPSNWIAL